MPKARMSTTLPTADEAYDVTRHTRVVSPYTSPANGPTQAPLSLVFLLDGSGSMTPCFRGVKRFIRNMILHLRQGYDSTGPAPPNVGGATASVLQFNDFKVRNEFNALNLPLLSPELSEVLEDWERIKKLGGTTKFLHAAQAAKEAMEAAPPCNNKLLVLITDGVADDWQDAIKLMIKIQTDSNGSMAFLVVGVAACSYYEDEFPVHVTQKLLGEQYSQQLFM